MGLTKLETLLAQADTLNAVGNELNRAPADQEFRFDDVGLSIYYNKKLQEMAEKKAAAISGDASSAAFGGMIASDSELASRKMLEDQAADFDSSKTSGDAWTINFPYYFEGTLSEFAKNPSLAECRPKAALLDKVENSRFFLLSSEITQVQNTTSIPVNFCLDGAPITNLHACPIGSNTANIAYWTAPHVNTPMQISHVFYDNSNHSDFEVTDVQCQFHKTTQADIEASLTDPSPEEFFGADNSWKSNPGLVGQYKGAIETMKADGLFSLVRKDSAVGHFIAMQNEAAGVLPSDIMQLDTHFIRASQEVDDYVEQLKEAVYTSPFNRVNDWVGKIYRSDGKAWNDVSGIMSDAEKDDLLNGKHVFSYVVKHRLATFKLDS